MIEQLLAQLRRQIGLGVIQNRSNIVLQRSSASALIVQKKRPVVAQHDVARLEITVEKIIAVGGQQEAGQAPKIIFQRLLIERDACETKKIIFEIVQVPGNRLAVKTAPRIANLVVQIAARLHLKARQHGNRLAVCLNYRRSNVVARAVLREKVKQRGVTQVFFQVSAMSQIFSINFRHGQAVTSKMPGEFQESYILFADVIANANDSEFLANQPDDPAA